MARTKAQATDSRIVNSMLAISESFRNLHVSQDDILQTAAPTGFIHYFEKIPDWRSPDMVEYKLPNLLLLAFLVILQDGTSSFYGIADHVRVCREEYERYGLIENGRCPSHDTFRRVFSLLDAQEVYEQTARCFHEFLRSLEACISGRDTYRHLMIDGKEMRGTGRSSCCRKPARNVQVLNIYDGSLMTCIHSEAIPEKTNEIPTAQAFLKGLSLVHTVVTADALHCQRQTADIVSKKKGLYVLTVRDNQPLLLAEIEARMEKHKSKVVTIERGRRTLEILHLPKGYATDGFTGMKAFVRMTSKAHSAQKTEQRCFISNTDKEGLICEAVEKRWEIENGLHKEKDGYLNEDLFRCTDRNAALSLAVMNNFALQMVRIYQAVSGRPLNEAKIYMRHYPLEGIQMILSIMSDDEVIERVKKEMLRIRKLGLRE